MNKYDPHINLTSWLKYIDDLRHSPDWDSDEFPVDYKQTHISSVLLGRRHALKLKKPVNFGFLDYTTLEKRLKACEAEIRLNRRLCPGIYLKVQPISIIDGKPRLSAQGEIIDFGVLMNRLPASRMLDQMVNDGKVNETIIDRIATKLAAFHENAERGPEIEANGSIDQIRFNWEENFQQSSAYIGYTIPHQTYDSIRDWIKHWFESNSGLLKNRVREGRICDGHGDVRCESICVTNEEIYIYDCIEFNNRFRCSDVASEVAFLATDLDARGRPDLGYYFTERYHAHSGDPYLFRMLPFYKCYRAYVRGKVLSFRLDESEFSEAEKAEAAARASAFFDLSLRYASLLSEPSVILISGLSGTGKTAISRAIAGELGLRVVSADAARNFLYGQDKRPANYGEGVYTPLANERTYQMMMETGRRFLEREGSIILDATFRRRSDRDQVREMARQFGARLRLVECRLQEDLVKQRLQAREHLDDGLSDATWETYLHQREEFDPIDPASADSYLALNTESDLLTVSHTVTDWLRSQPA